MATSKAISNELVSGTKQHPAGGPEKVRKGCVRRGGGKGRRGRTQGGGGGGGGGRF